MDTNLVVLKSKRCSKCKLVRDISCFYKSKLQSGGYQAYCRKCNLANLNKVYKTQDVNYRRMKSRQYLLKNKYGLTPEQYNAMLIEQNGVCAICERPETVKNKISGIINPLRVDHCHRTGKVRGLLCSECNFGISKFDDKMGTLLSAVHYILKSVQREKQNPANGGDC